MTESPLMKGFPPPPDGQVTLANWRTAPFNVWAFHHVREIVPSAEVPNDPGAARKLEGGATGLPDVTVDDGAGGTLDFDGFLSATNTDAIVVLKDGRIVAERYFNGMQAGQQHILMSVSKSVLGVVAGIVEAQGLLDLDSPVETIIPEVAATAYRRASLRQLLDMRAGVAFDEDYLATSGPIINYRKATNWNPLEPGEKPGDLRSFYAEMTEPDAGHGGRFHYVSPNTDLLGWVLERASGMRYADLVGEVLWAPMGAERPAYVTVDRLGAPRVAGGFCACARDLAMLGQLMAEGGACGGRQIIPEAWIDDIATAGDAEAWQKGSFLDLFASRSMKYRSKWYVELPEDGEVEPLLFGFGIHGQHLYVDRARNFVVAKFSSQATPIDPDRIKLTGRFINALRRAF